MDSCSEGTSEMFILFENVMEFHFIRGKTPFTRKGLRGTMAFVSPHTPHQHYLESRERRKKTQFSLVGTAL